MDRQFKNIAEINKESTSWTAKVKVVEKMSAKTWTTPTRTGTSQTLILMDPQGDCIQATIFGRDIQLYQHTLLPLQKYYISNAEVKDCLKKHQIVPNQLQWTINGRTLLENAPADFEMHNGLHFNLVPFHELETYLQSDKLIDIIAVVEKISPIRQVNTKNGPATIQEITLVNHDWKEVMLTMWDNFVSNESAIICDTVQSHPVLLGMRLKVVSFKGVSLSTRARSSFLIEPKIPEAAKLEIWRSENSQALQSFVDPSTCSSSSVPVEKKPVSIHDIPQLQLQNSEEFLIKASASITNFNQRFYYIGCSRCNKIINAERGTLYYCIHCRNDVTAKAKCRFEVELKDETGVTTATIFTENAKKIFKCTKKELIRAEDKVPLHTSTSYEWLIRLKVYKFREDTRQKYTITSVEADNPESSH